jgi:hypothetical protein
MLYLCEFTWQAGKSAREIGERMLQLRGPGDANVKIHHWYSLVGGGAGVIVVEADDPREVNAALTPWMDLISWDVRAVFETNLDEVIEQTRQRLGQQSG